MRGVQRPCAPNPAAPVRSAGSFAAPPTAPSISTIRPASGPSALSPPHAVTAGNGRQVHREYVADLSAAHLPVDGGDTGRHDHRTVSGGGVRRNGDGAREFAMPVNPRCGRPGGPAPAGRRPRCHWCGPGRLHSSCAMYDAAGQWPNHGWMFSRSPALTVSTCGTGDRPPSLCTEPAAPGRSGSLRGRRPSLHLHLCQQPAVRDVFASPAELPQGWSDRVRERVR